MNQAKILNKTTLGFALAVQVVIIAALLAARSGAVTEPEAFLSFDASTIDAVSVSNDEGTVNLVKPGDAWQLPEGLPADSSKVEGVLDKLSAASGGWPVGSQASTAERFEVADDNHQRHVTLMAGDNTLADFYLGTSPGYRKAHARHADDDDIYAITFSNYEAGVKESDWLDKSLLRPQGSLTGVERLDGFALSKADDGMWTAADGTELDQGKAETFAGRFNGLSVTGVSEAGLPDAPQLTFALTDEAGTQTLRIFHLESDDDYVAVSDRVPGAYSMSSYIAEQMDETIADLMSEAAEDAAGVGEADSIESPEPTGLDQGDQTETVDDAGATEPADLADDEDAGAATP